MRLEARTTGRADVLRRVDAALRQAATTQSRSHLLLVGSRGSGKSHVVEVALHRMRADASLLDALVVARLPEDAVGITSAADVLYETLVALRVPAGVLDLARSARSRSDVVALQELVERQLGDRCLVLVIENLHLVMTALGSAGQADLRAWVESSGRVLLLATAPLLFHAVQSRTASWFGSFTVEHLAGLTVDEGTELVRTIALEIDDPALAAFVATPRGRARLSVIHHLAGGSPRIWTIFASCVSLQQLDELVPAVEALLEELVPFYQQRLWELPGAEQKLLDTLARQAPVATVAQLAALSGVPANTTATSLRRLAKAGWVTDRKMPGLDQRTTWYELRETLLRHHLQYRDGRGEELQLIVELLQAWFDEPERQRELLHSSPGTVRAQYLAAAIANDPGRTFDSGYADRDVDALAATGAVWMEGRCEDLGTKTAGALLRTAVAQVRGEDVVDPATCDVDVLDAMRGALVEGGDDEADAVGAVINAAAAATSGVDHVVLEMIAAAWSGWSDPSRAAQRLGSLIARPILGVPHRLPLSVRQERAYWLGKSGRVEEALAEFEQVIADDVALLGPTHPDTLSSRHNHAYLLGEAGRVEEALAEFEQVIADRAERLGPTHPETLSARHSHAYWLGEAARVEEALAEFEQVIADRVEQFGTAHPDTLSTRHGHAYLLGQAGRVEEALAEFDQVIADYVEQLGTAHPDTLGARHNAVSLRIRHGDLSTTAVRQLIEDDSDLARSNWLLVQLARAQIGRGLSSTPELETNASARDLLCAVAYNRSAEAYANLPVEIRRLLEAE